ncbi:MAG: hypothetical protein D6744_15655, partial [Planctomycetota bacterium]
ITSPLNKRVFLTPRLIGGRRAAADSNWARRRCVQGRRRAFALFLRRFARAAGRRAAAPRV